MDVGPVARQEVAHVGPETAEADLSFQAQGAGQAQEVFSAGALAEHIQGEGSPGPLGFSQDLQQETVVLDKIKIADGDEVPERLLAGLACSGATKLPMTAEGTAAASGSQLKSAFCAHLDTYTRPSTCGITSRSTCRIARNTLPSRLISFLSAHSSAWEIRK